MVMWSYNWCLYFDMNRCSALLFVKKEVLTVAVSCFLVRLIKISNCLLEKDQRGTFVPKSNFNNHIFEINDKVTEILGILRLALCRGAPNGFSRCSVPALLS